LQGLAAKQTLLANLRYWISTQTVAIKIGNDPIMDAENLKNFIAAELNAAK
jgi:hypothetical protein